MEKPKHEKTEKGRAVEFENGEYSTELTEQAVKFY